MTCRNEIKPAMSDEFARFLWATAPRYHELRAIVQRARRLRYPRARRWIVVMSTLGVSLVFIAICLVFVSMGELTEEPIWGAAVAIWVFMPALFVIIVGQRVADDRVLRRAVHRLPRWYALRPRARGLRTEDASLIDQARRARDPLSAWREIRERVPPLEKGYNRLIGPELRWMCSGRHGWWWYAGAALLLGAFCVVVLVRSADADAQLADAVIEVGMIAFFGFTLVAGVAQHRSKKALARMAGSIGMTLTDRCAKCDYALKGLPPTYNAVQDVMEITCPECGLTHRV